MTDRQTDRRATSCDSIVCAMHMRHADRVSAYFMLFTP